MTVLPVLDSAGRRRSPATLLGYRVPYRVEFAMRALASSGSGSSAVPQVRGASAQRRDVLEPVEVTNPWVTEHWSLASWRDHPPKLGLRCRAADLLAVSRFGVVIKVLKLLSRSDGSRPRHIRSGRSSSPAGLSDGRRDGRAPADGPPFWP